MKPVTIDSTKRLHPVPPIRGVMTEWMYSGGRVDPGASVDPNGEAYNIGQALSLEEEDFATAAAAGVNTFRCSIEHPSLESRDTPGKYRKEGFDRIAQMLDWYEKYDLRAILDLHNAIGREGGGDPRLWQQTELQDRFVGVWKELATRFKDHPQVIAFEFLNEPEPRHTEDWDARHAVWNNLAKRTTDAVRKIAPNIPLIINTIEYANVAAFKGLKPTGDDNTSYSFHWYAPSQFHCQKRSWLKDQGTYHYPDDFGGKWWNRDTIRAQWQPALDFAARHKVPLFCGEFGCVSECPEMEDMVWLLDVISLFDQLNITWTYFHYMFRTADPRWLDRFDCNMFIYEQQNKRLRPLDRKVSLLGDLMKLSGDVLKHDQPEDPDVLVYAVAQTSGELRIYASNKSRKQSKSVQLSLAGGPWAESVDVKRMACGTGGYVVGKPASAAAGKIELTLEPLTIQRLTIRPKSIF